MAEFNLVSPGRVFVLSHLRASDLPNLRCCAIFNTSFNALILRSPFISVAIAPVTRSSLALSRTHLSLCSSLRARLFALVVSSRSSQACAIEQDRGTEVGGREVSMARLALQPYWIAQATFPHGSYLGLFCTICCISHLPPSPRLVIYSCMPTHSLSSHVRYMQTPWCLLAPLLTLPHPRIDGHHRRHRSTVPEHIKPVLSATEVEFFNEYDGLVRSYARDCGMELAAVRHGEGDEGKEHTCHRAERIHA